MNQNCCLLLPHFNPHNKQSLIPAHPWKTYCFGHVKNIATWSNVLNFEVVACCMEGGIGEGVWSYHQIELSLLTQNFLLLPSHNLQSLHLVLPVVNLILLSNGYQWVEDDSDTWSNCSDSVLWPPLRIVYWVWRLFPNGSMYGQNLTIWKKFNCSVDNLIAK